MAQFKLCLDFSPILNVSFSTFTNAIEGVSIILSSINLTTFTSSSSVLLSGINLVANFIINLLNGNKISVDAILNIV
ncbi:hypothetical protein SDC9_209251 [bioreactor metagenome]|uniref:Uncharacterized protein n=1 Tax=bioreactor metagenome TaxID=1076179 RepID=A0A645JPK7_9ZZZZ